MNVVEKNRGALVIIVPLVIALVAVCVVYDPFHLITGNPETGEGAFAHAPLWAWVIGVGVLGSVISYGILQTRRRTPAQAQTTEEVTKDLYRREEADRERQRLP